MEDVDAILLPILRESGCPLPPELTSMKQLDSDLFYTSSVTILRLINSSSPSSSSTSPLTKHPLAMPTGKAARFRITSALCAEIKGKGYPAELGYESFLYPNEAEMRRLLRFLVEKLPKLEPAEADDLHPTSPAADIHSRVHAALLAFSKQTTPLSIARHPYSTVQLELPALSPAAALAYTRGFQPLLPLQPARPSAFIPSLLELNLHSLLQAAEREKQWNDPSAIPAEQRRLNLIASMRAALSSELARVGGATTSSRRALHLYAVGGEAGVGGGLRATAFSRRVQFEQEAGQAQAQVVSEVGTVTRVNDVGQSAEEREAEEEERRRTREQQLTQLNTQLTDTSQTLAALDTRISSFSSSSRQLEAELLALASSTTALEEAYKVKKRTLDLLPEAQKNESELRALVDASSARLLDLATEWETHRQSLLNRLRRAHALLQERKEAAAGKAEVLKSMREEQKTKADDLQAKDGQLTAAQAELAALTKGASRLTFIRRIMDIMRNIDKQKAEIHRVLTDVRQVQRDINQLTEAAHRAYAVADDIVFSAAKAGGGGDAVGAKAYRQVVELREAFGGLVGVVEGIGRMQGEMRELQASVADLEGRNTALNMERVETDLAQVKKENKALTAKLKAK